MTWLNSEHCTRQYIDMAKDLMTCNYKVEVKPSSGDGHRIFDYHGPVSVTAIPNGLNPQKRSCSSSCSAMRCRKHLSKSKSYSISKATHLWREELHCIKKELKVIKKQIDGLLNSLEHMGTQRTSSSEVSKSCSALCSIKASSCTSIRSIRTVGNELSFHPRESSNKQSQVKSTDVHMG